MPLEKPDNQHLGAAHDYIQLGMFEETNAELEEIDAFCRHLPEVLLTRVVIYRALEKSELMATVAKKLVEWDSDEPGNFIDWAYAIRRAESMLLAHAILSRGAELHPDDGMIPFNLACYEARLGNIEAAKEHLARATKADKKFGLMALDDRIWNRSGRHSLKIEV